MDIIRPFIQKNNEELLNAINNRLRQDLWDKYCLGTISKWEMDAISCYIHEHELTNLKNGLYGLVKFSELPEDPVVNYEFKSKETGQKIHNFQIYQNRIFLQEQAKEVIVDYTFTYEDKIKVIEVGNRLLNGFLRLDGKMSIKDERSGKVTTGIMEMPKIRLSSDLAIQLGSSYSNSAVSNFHFTGFIDESERKDQQKIAKITFLETELTGDYI